MSRGTTPSARASQVSSLLANNQAQFVSFEFRERLFNNELTRMWPVERDDLVDAAYAHLRTINTVTDPMAGAHETFPGVWRVVDVRKASYDNESQFAGVSGVVQVLRYGYSQELNWGEARVISMKESLGNTSSAEGQAGTQSDNPDRFLLIEFVNLDPATAPGLLSSALGASTYSGFTVRGVTFAPTYHKLAATVLESEFPGDGSARIQVLLAQPQYTLEAFKDYVALYNGQRRSAEVYYLWGVPKDQAQGIMNVFEGSGRSATADYNADQNLVNITLVDSMFHPMYGMYADAMGAGGTCSFEDTIQFYWGIYNPTESVYNPSSFSDYRSPGITYDRRITFDRETGSFDIVISKRTTTTRRYTPFVSRLSTLDEESTYIELGVTDNIYFDLPNFPPAQGVIYNQDVSPNPDCSKDVKTRWTESKEHSWYEAVLSDSAPHGFWWFVNQRAIPSAIIDALDPTYNNRISFDINPDKTYNGSITSSPPGGLTTYRGYSNFYYTEADITSAPFSTESGDGEKVKQVTYYVVYSIKYVSYHASEYAAYGSNGAARAIGNLSVSPIGGAVWRAERTVRRKIVKLAPDDLTNFYLTDMGNLAGTAAGLGAEL